MKRKGLLLQHVSKSFNGKEVLKDISLSVKPGKVLAIIGSSGGGKTTLLRCINLLTPINEGRIIFNRRLIASSNKGDCEIGEASVRRRIGIVFQEWNLWQNKTVRDNIAEGPQFVLGKGKKSAYRLAERLAKEVGIEDKLESYPHELSGGQKQRVAIARALAMNPQVLMLDEVTSALDPLHVAEILELIRKLKNKKRMLIIVTHHIEFAKKIADKIAFLSEGRIHEYGEAREVLDYPKTSELRNFLQALEKVR